MRWPGAGGKIVQLATAKQKTLLFERYTVRRRRLACSHDHAPRLDRAVKTVRAKFKGASVHAGVAVPSTKHALLQATKQEEEQGCTRGREGCTRLRDCPPAPAGKAPLGSSVHSQLYASTYSCGSREWLTSCYQPQPFAPRCL